MNRKATAFSALLLLVLLSSLVPIAIASGTNPPLVGTYKSLLGGILPGRASESAACDGCDGQLGNMLDAASWNGSTLGTNWQITCPQISAAPILIFDGVVAGNGQRIYQTVYSGGTLWLAGSGAWGTGDPAYTGGFTSFYVVATQQLVAGQVVGVVSNINFTGSLDGYDNCFTLAISNAELVGATPGAPSESGAFPAFEGPSDCNLTGTHGAYWDVHDLTFSILGRCEVSTRRSTWGAVKNMYR
jgi:hypothetical protein